MTGVDSQLQAVRERLRHLMKTHQQQLDAQQLTIQQGELVIRQGDRADAVMLVERGRLSIELERDGAEPLELATVEAGELVGEMGLFGDSHHTAAVRAREGPVDVLRFNSDALLQYSLFDSELVLELLALSSARCRAGNLVISQLLDGLTALVENAPDQLDAVCTELEQGPESLRTAARQFRALGENAHAAAQPQRAHRG